MQRLTALLATLAIACAMPVPAKDKVPTSQFELTLSFAPVVQATAPAVVNIYARRIVPTRTSPFANDPIFGDLFRGQNRIVPRAQNSLGSGVIVSPDGIVVSNYHVVGMATEINVVLSDRREFEAEVLLGDEEADLAVLKLKDAADLPALAFTDSDEAQVGDLVLAIGNPFGVGQTVSSGIISGLARSGLSIGSGRGYFLQTDAPINPGNSGGALVDMRGHLLGINTAILTRSGGSNGIGFAIPANLVHQYVEQALRGNTSFDRPWAGLTGQTVNADLADGLGLRTPLGMLISDLHPLSPFAAAGLEVGDVVISVDNVPVNTPQELYFRLSATGVGGKVRVGYLRKGREKDITVALVPAPEEPPRTPFVAGGDAALAGLSVINVNPAVIVEFNLPSQAVGVVVQDPGPIGERAGLRVGDILLGINGNRVATTGDVARLLGQATRTWRIDYVRGATRGVLRFRL